jgi:hypothetical protein
MPAIHQVVVVTRQTATGRESGVPVELKLWQLADIEDGRLIASATI